MEYHKKDSTWDAFNVTSTQDHLNRFMPNLSLVEDVHEDIKAEYKTIKQLITCSYYHYQMYDEAVRKALFTFEMALKLRYKEITSKDSGRKSMERLIKVLSSHDLFNVSENFLTHLRQIRNSFAHPKRYSFGGAMLYHWIENVTLIINELYEPLSDRKFRKKEIARMNSFFEKMLSSRALVYQYNPKSFFQIHDIKCLLFDRKTNQYLLVLYPAFDLKAYQGKNYHGAIPAFFTVIENLSKVDGLQKTIGNNLRQNKQVEIYENSSASITPLLKQWLDSYESLEQHHVLEAFKGVNISREFRKIKQRFITQKKIILSV